MVIVNLALRFAVELVGVAAFAYWGFQVSDGGAGGVAFGTAAALAFIVVWAVVVAPKARNPLSQRQRDVIGTVLLLVGAAALATAGQPAIAAAYAAIVVLNQVLLIASNADADTSLRSAAGRSH